MSKRDRQGVRTPADIERKYDLGKLNTFRGDSTKQDTVISELTQKVDQFIADTNANIEEINNSISGFDKKVDDAIDKSLAEAKASGEFDGEKGDPGEKGDAGVSPTVTVSSITGGHRVTITDAEGTETFDVMDGKDGANNNTPIYIANGTDFDNLKDIGDYTGDASARNYVNCPFSSGTFDLKVVSQGPSGQRKQIITAANKEKNMVAVRFFYQNSWGEWSYLHNDTGWLDIPLSSGLSYGNDFGYLKGRVKNGVFYIKGDVVGISANWTRFATLPASLRVLTGTHRFGCVYNMSHFCGVALLADGNFSVTTLGTGSWVSTNALSINVAIGV